MARRDEIAEGIATILVTVPDPEPLCINLRGEGPVETTFLVRAVIDSCERRGSPIRKVLVGSKLGADLLKQHTRLAASYEGVKIEVAEAFISEVEFYRFS